MQNKNVIPKLVPVESVEKSLGENVQELLDRINEFDRNNPVQPVKIVPDQSVPYPGVTFPHPMDRYDDNVAPIIITTTSGTTGADLTNISLSSLYNLGELKFSGKYDSLYVSTSDRSD